MFDQGIIQNKRVGINFEDPKDFTQSISSITFGIPEFITLKDFNSSYFTNDGTNLWGLKVDELHLG